MIAAGYLAALLWLLAAGFYRQRGLSTVLLICGNVAALVALALVVPV